MVKKLGSPTTESVPCSWIKRLRLTVVKRTMFFNTTSKFNTILIEIPVGFFAETVNLILKSIGRYNRPSIAKKTQKAKQKTPIS